GYGRLALTGPSPATGRAGAGPTEQRCQKKRSAPSGAPPPAAPLAFDRERRVSRAMPRSLLLGGDHHDHLPAFQPGARFDDDILAEVGLDPGGHLAAKFLVTHLAAAEADVDLDLVAFLDETAHLAQLDLVVAVVGDGPELHFLDLD